jgi:hypothetical protein
MPPKLLCSMFHQRFMKYMNCTYHKFFCWYFTKLNDIKFSRFFKLCPLVLPLNCFLSALLILVGTMKTQWCYACFSYFLCFKSLWVLKFKWPPSWFVVMYVNCFDGEKLFLWKFVILTFCLVPTRLKTLFYLFLNSKLIVSIFGLFQSLEWIKYMLYLCWVLVFKVQASFIGSSFEWYFHFETF